MFYSNDNGTQDNVDNCKAKWESANQKRVPGQEEGRGDNNYS